MVEFSLIPHPDFPSAAVTAISVSVERDGGALNLAFIVEGDLAAIVWPAPAEHARTDELWKHTCYEVFVKPECGSAYTELNFSPSGRWAAYSFDAPRRGMRRFEPPFGEVSGGMSAKGLLSRKSTWRFCTFDVLGGDDWRLGLTAVVEATGGTKSYWALAHASGPPDFHNPDCFIAKLPAPERS